jgi:hypothetical protein
MSEDKTEFWMNEYDGLRQNFRLLERRESKLYYLLSEWNRYYTAPDGNVKVFSDLVRETQDLLTEIGELYLKEAYLAYQAEKKK